ncbi:MAG: YdbH domain-containing protein [Desulfobacteraceae bacterium]|nr:YdbH domain-containing protein [Desulfobacteraceae bacterium]
MRYKSFFIAAFVIVLISLAFVLAGLPVLAQHFIENRFHQVLTEQNAAFTLQRVGLTQTLVSDLRLGTDVSADLVHVTYDLQGLDLPVPRHLTISGLQVKAGYDKTTGFVIDGIAGRAASPGTAKPKTPKKEMALHDVVTTWLPFLPDKIVLQNAGLTVTIENQTVRIPFDMDIFVDKTQKTATCNATLYPFGQPITVTTRLDTSATIKAFTLQALAFDSGHLARFLPETLGPLLSGSLDLMVEQTSHNNWQISVSGLHPDIPGGFGMDRISLRMLKDHSRIMILGQFGLSHPLLSDLVFSSRAVVEMDQAGGGGIPGFELTCESQPTEAVVLENQHLSARMERPLVTLSLKGTNQTIAGNFSVRASQTQIRQENKTLSFDQAFVKSDIQGDLAARTLDLNVQSQLSKVHVKTPDGVVQFRRMETAGQIFMDRTHLLQDFPKIALTTELLQGSIDAPSLGIAARGISAQLPVTFPDAGGTGRFSVEKMVYNDHLHLNAAGNIHRTGPFAIDFDGVIAMPDAAELSIGFTGNAGMTPDFYAGIDLVSERFRFSPFRFEKLMPQDVRTADYDLDVTTKGSFLWENSRVKTGAELIIHDGTLSLPDMNMTAAGIRGNLVIKDLLNLASFPGQIVTIDEIQAGDFRFTDAAVRFTLGRIPVRFKEGDISFENGFLFSTPGQGGRITINNTQKLVAGIPMDSPQFVQLDLAREALKDFEYSWAKLTFNTQKDTLSVNMEMDGKPGRVLPFVYKKEVGSFVRVDAQSPGSHFQGITLDVNLTLPFNQVIKFGNKIQKLLQ